MEHSTTTLKSCGALFYCPATKRYLFLLRDNCKHSGTWGLVGGKVDPGETVAQALHREVQEEVALVLSTQKIIPIEQFTSDNHKFEFHTFLIVVSEEFVPKLNHEHRGYCWVGINDYPRPLHPGVWRSFKFDAIKSKILTLEQVLSNISF